MTLVSKELLYYLVKGVAIGSATFLRKQAEIPSGPTDLLRPILFSNDITGDEEMV